MKPTKQKPQQDWEEELKKDCKQKVERWSKNGVTTGKKALDGETIIDIDLDDDEAHYIKFWESLYLFTKVRINRIISTERTKLLNEVREEVEGLAEDWDGSDNPNVQLALHDVLSALNKLEENK